MVPKNGNLTLCPSNKLPSPITLHQLWVNAVVDLILQTSVVPIDLDEKILAHLSEDMVGIFEKVVSLKRELILIRPDGVPSRRQLDSEKLHPNK